MGKYFYFLVICLFCHLAVFAQQDSLKKHKKRASAYDSNAIYYNKGKLNFCADIGTNGIAFSYAGTPGGSGYPATPGIYGTPSSLYQEASSPSYNVSAYYGVTAKSAMGINAAYMQTNYDPVVASPSVSAGKISILYIGIRYAHCIRSWRFFYYGLQFSTAFVKATVDTNTFFDKPTVSVPALQAMFGCFLGFRYPIDDNLWLHIEVQEHFPLINTVTQAILVNEMFGLNYSFNLRKKKYFSSPNKAKN